MPGGPGGRAHRKAAVRFGQLLNNNHHTKGVREIMEVQLKTRSGRLLFKVEGSSTKELFAQIAAIQDVFDIETVCGCCGKDNIRYRHRMFDDNEFFELVCDDCRGTLAFGQRKGKDGQLFPRRKDKNDRWLDKNGWSVYKPERETANVQ